MVVPPFRFSIGDFIAVIDLEVERLTYLWAADNGKPSRIIFQNLGYSGRLTGDRGTLSKIVLIIWLTNRFVSLNRHNHQLVQTPECRRLLRRRLAG